MYDEFATREERIAQWEKWRGTYRRDWGRWSLTYAATWFEAYYPRTGKMLAIIGFGMAAFLLISSVLAYAAVPFVVGSFVGLADSEGFSVLLLPVELLWLCLLLGFIVVVLDP